MGPDLLFLPVAGMKLSLILLSFLAVAVSLHAGILHKWDFEGHDPFRQLSIEGENPEVVSDPLRPGNRVMLAVLKPDSTRSERSEVRWDTVKPAQECWVGVKILVPETNAASPCLFQLGPIRYRNPSDAANGGWVQYIQQHNPSGGDEWRLRGYFERFGLSAVKSDHGKIGFNEWQSWIAHFKASADQTGFIEIWKGNDKILDLKGKTAKESDFFLLPIKWGIYVGVGSKVPSDTKAYYDNVVIADKRFDLAKMRKALE